MADSAGWRRVGIGYGIIVVAILVVLLSVLPGHRRVPSSARDALNAVSKLQSRIEVGITYATYTNAVGETWGEVKVFIESPHGKNLPELSELLRKIMTDHKKGVDTWKLKIDEPSVEYAQRLREVRERLFDQRLQLVTVHTLQSNEGAGWWAR